MAARPIHTADQLADVIEKAIGRRGRIHPATLTFQALRIAVNDELGSLMSALPQATGLLHSGGRLAVISFHSLEDRIVKEYFRSASQEHVPQPDDPPGLVYRSATLRLITRKPIVASEAEVSEQSAGAQRQVCELRRNSRYERDLGAFIGIEQELSPCQPIPTTRAPINALRPG